jgi:uncharacterized protein YjgD (DUF1641 family)
MGNTALKRDMAGEAVLQSITEEMVKQLVEKGVAAVELLDDILQPETLALLRRLPDASDNLSKLLEEVRRLEESGALKTLAEMVEVLAQLKSAWTGPMVVDAMDKAGKAIEAADVLVQKGVPELVDGILTAFESACKERREAEEPLSLFQIFRAMSDPEVREGIRFLLSFAKALSRVLKNELS